MRRRNWLIITIAIALVFLFAMSSAATPINEYLGEQLNPETPEEFEEVDFPITKSSEPTDLIFSSVATQPESNAIQDTGQIPVKSSGGCSNGHDCVSTSYSTPIDMEQGLELWVQFENDSWFYSSDLNDLNTLNSDNFKYVVLKNRFGAAGFMVADSGAFSHGQVVVAPVLPNGIQMKVPLAGIYFKGYVDTGTQIRSTFLTNRSLGYDYSDYLEVTDNGNEWILGWSISDMELEGQNFDITLQISLTESSRRAKILHQITPKSRGYDDIGIEYAIIGNPKFQGTNFDITKIRAWGNDSIYVKYLNETTDIKEVPNFVERADLVTANDLVVHSFDFYDILFHIR